MEFLESNPFLTLTIVLAIASPIVGWLLLRRFGPTMNWRRVVRLSFVLGAALILGGLILTASNIADGRYRMSFAVFIGLGWCWNGWALRRANARAAGQKPDHSGRIGTLPSDPDEGRDS